MFEEPRETIGHEAKTTRPARVKCRKAYRYAEASKGVNDRVSIMKQHQEEFQQIKNYTWGMGHTRRTTAKEAKSKRQSKLTAAAKAIEDLEDHEITSQSKQPQKRQHK